MPVQYLLGASGGPQLSRIMVVLAPSILTTLPRPLGYSQIGVGHRAIGEEDASPGWLRSFAGPRLCDVVLLMRLLRRQTAAGNGLLTE